MNSHEDANRKTNLKLYRTYYSVLVYAEDEREAIVNGFDYLDECYRGHDSDDDDTERVMGCGGVAFERAEIVREGGE